MQALRLETPSCGEQYLWVMDRNIVKRLHVVDVTREQLQWLVLASPFEPVPIEAKISLWKNGAFEATVSAITVLPHTRGLIASTLPNTTKRRFRTQHHA